MAKVVLIGLDGSAANQLAAALSESGHQVELSKGTPSATVLAEADILFASGEDKNYLSVLRSIRNLRPDVPFVVVTRVPETAHWLDALEAGATDYCSAPFEPKQIRWLMESALPRMAAAAA